MYLNVLIIQYKSDIIFLVHRKKKAGQGQRIVAISGRSDERHLQSLEASRVVTNNLLEQISARNTALLGLMGRVVTVMEAGRK